ncbi:MAG: hypothetical protein GXP41_06505, partial [Chloroflexi bacterium]|nr:hypothetical protein [Chloroflexota bacterium]
MQLLGVDTWDEVVNLFQHDIRYAGHGGWLEVLRLIERGDSVYILADYSMWSGLYGAQKLFAGQLVEQNGQLLLQGLESEGFKGQTLSLDAALHNGGKYYWVERNQGPNGLIDANRMYYRLRFDWDQVDKDAVVGDTIGLAGNLGPPMMLSGMP